MCRGLTHLELDGEVFLLVLALLVEVLLHVLHGLPDKTSSTSCKSTYTVRKRRMFLDSLVHIARIPPDYPIRGVLARIPPD